MKSAKPERGGESPGPLEKVRILDIGSGLAGPVAATLLADFGAEVIKIEQPGKGDWLRTLLPPFKGTHLWWVVEGRNKKAITLDLDKPRGREVFEKMVPWADVIIENYMPGTLERWNLTYDVLSELNSRVILVRCSGFGQEGPYKNRVAYDRIGQAFSGIVYRTGHPDSMPVFPGVAIADYGTAIFAALGTMIALYYRDTVGDGRGQVVDSCLYESVLRIYEAFVPLYDQQGVIAERTGNIRRLWMPGGLFPTKDDKLVLISIAMNQHFTALAEAL